MNKMNIKDANNQMIEVFLVRYFKYKNTNYLIYTLNEVDEKGFIKLYLVKIMKQFNEWIAKTIKDDEEWKRMQLIVKNILKEIKSGNIESFNDLCNFLIPKSFTVGPYMQAVSNSVGIKNVNTVLSEYP